MRWNGLQAGRAARTVILCALAASSLSACAVTQFGDAKATGHYVLTPEQCVPYARDVSGINIHGNAGTWWNKGKTLYDRGHYPEVGSVLVLAQTRKMPYGHVAVVTKILDNRHIDVTHSDWGDDMITRRVIYSKMRVEDISRNNDWSLVHFWNYDHDCYGFPYPAKGFIYPHPPVMRR